MKGILNTVFVALCATSSFAMTYWKGGDGAWNDPDMWSHGVPNLQVEAAFTNGVGGRVQVSGKYHTKQLLIGTSGVAVQEIEPVVFYGGGEIVATNETSAGSYIYPGRNVVLENVTLNCSKDNTSLSITSINGVGSTLTVKRGGFLEMMNGRTYVREKCTLFLDGGEGRGNMSLFGTFRMTAGSYKFTQKAPTISAGSTIDITGGTIIYGEEMRGGQVFTSDAVGFFPRCADASLVVNVASSEEGFAVNLETSPNRAVYKLAGTVSLTNYVTSGNLGTFSATSNMVFYGGGTLAANWICQRKFKDFDFGLRRVLLGSGLRSGSSTSEYRFHGDVVFGSYSDWRWVDTTTMMSIDGDVTFDSDDCFGSVAAHTLRTPPLQFAGSAASASFIGGGDVKCRFFSVPTAPNSIRSLQFADGMDVVFSDIEAARPSYFVRDFIAGANAQYTIPAKCVNSHSNVNFVCLNNTVLPATAQFTAIYEAASANPNTGAFYPVFSAAPDGDWPDPANWTLVRADANSGVESAYEMRIVGPTVYLRDGKRATGTSYDRWVGGVDGKFSTVDNWSNKSASNNSIWLTGELNCVVTNDLTSLSVKGLRVASCAGPYVLRGNKINVKNAYVDVFGNSSSSIYHGGLLPFIIECDMSQSAAGGFSATVDTSTYMALMGDMSLSGHVFYMRGEVLVGNTFTASDLAFRNKAQYGGETVLHVLSTGEVKISNQVSSLTNTACVSICGGGKMRFEGGSFRYAKVTNTNVVDGLLDIAVPFSCGADDADTPASDIGFEGTGVVSIASVKSSSLGNSAVKLNGKVSLLPPAAGWTTVTADATDSAITLALPEWGRATLAPTNDFVYGPADGVSPSTVAADRAFACGRFSELTVDSDYAVAFADPLVFAPYATLMKKGAGTLSFTTGNDVFPETLKVEAGTFAWSVPVAVTNLEVTAGAKLAFGSVAGVVSPISVAESVSLEGVEIAPADAATRMALSRGTTVIEVPAYRKITGTPVCGPLMKLSVANTASGGMALKVSPIFGAQFIVR